MTTEELLWNAAFEEHEQDSHDSYSYSEEWIMERYHEDKELFERFGEFYKEAS